MYRKIMVPVDPTHADKLAPAPDTAANISELYETPDVRAGVTAATPAAQGHTPEDHGTKPREFSGNQGERFGIATGSRAVASEARVATHTDASVLLARPC